MMGRVLLSVVASAAMLFGCRASLAGDEALPTPPQAGAPPSIHSGGLLEESYNYHRRQPVPTQPMRSAIETGGIPQANGWYSYGFPARSYRWGYFGAERHYPRVMWHQGYYGECVRTAYRDHY